jgi:hypothetical protein
MSGEKKKTKKISHGGHGDHGGVDLRLHHQSLLTGQLLVAVAKGGTRSKRRDRSDNRETRERGGERKSVKSRGVKDSLKNEEISEKRTVFLSRLTRF